ncbi:2'-5' RNA ligase family protein [Sinorhizobium garamanticum]|uniref:2'-5' RNA ligase family protein n=1 Tax=Sinorhizobium garamanticum TaxID=680247 RepID=A0ABY8DDQ7_9HYPH|nr:2'-5' RNA ligase family protein [Sinorhizobium garamanticum]WEX88432.1 2'-5' RNA ligase family protein [Sinorhizobium garamanticum]
MSSQLSFGFSAAPARTQNDLLYFAVLPKPAAADKILNAGRRLKEEYRLSGRLYPAERLHVSLAGIGRFDGLHDEVIRAARQIGDRIKGSPFEVRLDRALGFPAGHSRAVVLSFCEGVEALVALHRQIAAIAKAPRQSFVPHLTLLYDRVFAADVELLEPISWTVHEFVLVHSLYGQGRHRHLHRWRLTT